MLIRVKGRETLEGKEGETLLSALGRGGIVLSAPCGGRGICGKCGVRLLEGGVRGARPDRNGVVLSCQAVLGSDISIEILSDEAVLENELGRDKGPDPGAAPVRRAGIALDIGTTTVSARLLDLDSAQILGSRSRLNDQRIHGADVMSRIEAAQRGGLQELHRLINRETAAIIGEFIEQYRIETVESLAVAGNTAMLHLFANADPSGLGRVPFTPVFLGEKIFSGKDLNLPVERVKLLPSAGPFFGADVVAGLAVLDVLNAKEPVMLLDIGTNGEIGLFHGGRLLCCSTAAGPALEGAEISCGMGAVRGAISRVAEEEGRIVWKTIGGAEPLGLCGCGLIDAVAVMLKRGVIDETGAFADDAEEPFVITGDVSISGRDIRQYQLAKSAILSGAGILCRRAGVEPDGLGRVFIAGGLGFFIDPANALDTGILPREFGGKISVCGNSSLQGAVKYLLEDDFAARCRQIVESCEIIDLAADPEFMDAFAENMFFPEP